MKSIFITQDVWEIIEDGYEKPKDADEEASWDDTKKSQYKQNKRRDHYALSIIYRSVDETILPTIMAATTAKEAWSILETKYRGSEKPESKKLIISRDVIFDEGAQWQWNENNSEVPVASIPTTSPDQGEGPNDLIYTGTSPRMIEEFKKSMMSEYEMTDLGEMKYFLGMQVKQSPGRIFLSQEKYAENMLKKFNMRDCKPMATPMATNEKLSKNDGKEKVDASFYRSLVGYLIYLTNTRPDIVHAVSIISSFMSEPSKAHLAAAKRILRYIKGTKSRGIMYKSEIDYKLIGYTDSDWAGSIDDRRSTSGYVFQLGSKSVSWSSRKQATVALSSAEAEYISATSAACEAVWLRRILKDLQQDTEGPTTIYCDNMSAIAMTKNPVFHSRTKHIEIRHHFIRELVEKQEIGLQFCKTGEQLADIFTKALPTDKFLHFRRELGVQVFQD
uniref:Reverse transcriptase Ty1/copia-type domain-containing protein n=1 Tax=Chenopodium quinoa TaxID=63459 RepID=A0A803L0D4_CHEQI